MVWADPVSLAATYGIEVSLFSYRYLDVSVLCVRSDALYIQAPVTHHVAMIRRVAPFRNPRINA